MPVVKFNDLKKNFYRTLIKLKFNSITENRKTTQKKYFIFDKE